MPSVEGCDAEFSDNLGARFRSFLYSRSIDTKTTSEEGSKSLMFRSPKHCSACCNPPSRALLKYRFFCFLRDAIGLPSPLRSNIFWKDATIEFIKKNLENEAYLPCESALLNFRVRLSENSCD
jgi:hypothetical protein